MLYKQKWVVTLWIGLTTFSYGMDDAEDSGTTRGSAFQAVDDLHNREADHQLFQITPPSAPNSSVRRSDHAFVSVADEPRLSSSMRKRISMGVPTSLTQELLEVRNTEVKKWAKTLMCSQFGWYRAGNIAEAGSQICQVLTPVLSGCAAGFKNDSLALTAMCFGIVGVALARFSHYAHGESAERGDAANRFLLGEGVLPIVVIKDSVGGTTA